MKKKKKFNIPFLPIFLSICIFCLSIGYASLNSITGEIIGKIFAIKQDGVFITEVSYSSDLYANKDESKINDYVKTTLNSTVSLSTTQGDSAITYAVTVYNSTQNDYMFNQVLYADEFYDNDNIIFELTDLEKGDLLISGAYLTFYVTFSYLNDTVSTDNILNSYLNFEFVEIVTRYCNLEITYTITPAWEDGNNQFYRADFVVTNVGNEDIDNWSIVIPFDEKVSLNSGWGNDLTVEYNSTDNSIVVENTNPLVVAEKIEFTIQFGVSDKNFIFDEFIVADSSSSCNNQPEVTPTPTPEVTPTPTPEVTPTPTPEVTPTPTPEVTPTPTPEVTPTPTPEVTPTPTPGGSTLVYTTEGLEIKFTRFNEWDNGQEYFIHYDMVVTNTTEETITDWQVAINIPDGTKVGQSWNLNIIEEIGYIIISTSSSGNTLEPGASYSEGGFIFESIDQDYAPTLK